MRCIGTLHGAQRDQRRLGQYVGDRQTHHVNRYRSVVVMTRGRGLPLDTPLLVIGEYAAPLAVVRLTTVLYRICVMTRGY